MNIFNAVTIDQMEARMGFDQNMTAYDRLSEAPVICTGLARECINTDGLEPIKTAMNSYSPGDVKAAHSLMLHLAEDLTEWFPE